MTEKVFGLLPYSADCGVRDVGVGIDQSLTGFGLSLITTDGKHYESFVYASPFRGVDRLLDIQEWVHGKFERAAMLGYTIADVAMEAPVRASMSALVMGEVVAATKIAVRHAVLTGPGAYPLQVAPATLKKYVTGSGSVKVAKSQMLLNVYKKWGIEFSDDNAADSYGLARIAASLADNKYELDVITQLTDVKYRDAQYRV